MLGIFLKNELQNLKNFFEGRIPKKYFIFFEKKTEKD